MLNKGFCVNNGEIKIDNGILRVIVDYQRGGNISSLYFNNKNFELLFQPKHSNLDIPQKGDSFEKYAATGFDDTFPNIEKLYIRAERLLIMIMVTFGRQE
jgi:hypothetical protein